MRVLHVCTEMYPLLKTGGLADVLGALPSAQNQEGADARLLLPAFPAFQDGVNDQILVAHLSTFAGPVSVRYGNYQGVNIYLIDAPHLYHRPGSPYHDSHHNAYSDNHLRFALLGWIACEIACGLDHYWRPDVIHAHDWHAGLTCAYLAVRGHPVRSVFTVHNLAYHGLFAPHHLAEIALPEHLFQMYGLEYYGQISYLKAGLFYADHITTVSPTYAQEITEPEFSHGMEGLLLERYHQGRLSGILNGVDNQIWDPATDQHLVTTYNTSQLKRKTFNKTDLQAAMGLQVNKKTLLFAIVSRLTEQKGLDLVLDILPTIIHHGGQLAILGNGDTTLEARCLAAAAKYPGRVKVHIAYDEDLSHRMIGGADVIMVPSRFEPCGLTQLYGLQYGTLPLVRHTGGLADTVTDCSLENLTDHSATGFVFHDCHAQALDSATRRAFALWERPKIWHRVQHNAMKQSFGWKVAAKTYLALYQHLL